MDKSENTALLNGGNNAAMYAALKSIVATASMYFDNGMPQSDDKFVDEIIDKAPDYILLRDDWIKAVLEARKALYAEPPRNCDRPFKTLKEFQKYYIEHGCKKGLGAIVDGEIKKAPWKSNFEKWMLLPMGEQV